MGVGGVRQRARSPWGTADPTGTAPVWRSLPSTLLRSGRHGNMFLFCLGRWAVVLLQTQGKSGVPPPPGENELARD